MILKDLIMIFLMVIIGNIGLIMKANMIIYGKVIEVVMKL